MAEKIGQMTLVEKGSIDPAGVKAALVGGVLSGGGGAPPDNTPAGWHAMVAAYQAAARGTRLAIPILYGVDAVHGHNNVPGATIFPHNVGLGAVGDLALVEKIGRATAVETGATGIRWDYAPVVAVPQDIRWGRTYEGYGESTALVQSLGAAFITGLQGPDLAAESAVAATPKHFVGDGGTAWGTSGRPDYQIDQGVTAGDEALIRSSTCRPYRDAIAAGARIVMAVVLRDRGRRQDPRRPPLAHRHPEGRARLRRLHRVGLAGRGPGRPRLRDGRGPLDQRRHRHGDGPLGLRPRSSGCSTTPSRAGRSRSPGSTTRWRGSSG
jgi:beta-glucosidase-like glycosyl hydrolase